ncbi:coiled-coil domain-containing protein 181 [Brachionichthys hirsutus]|uniref:coiled-coil domain-containing protein 181 n=1 Tax=Brachionichthys hirsutus TaxID=412623 RepID=UPI003604BF42
MFVSDLLPAVIMSEVVCKAQDEYEDDFEKDLDWLIGEESRSKEHGPDYEEIEAQIDKELQEDEKRQEKKRKPKGMKIEKRDGKTEALGEDEEERWPSPMDPLQYDSDRDSPSRSPPTAGAPPGMADQTDEDKEYILEKIQQANRELQGQEAPDRTRRRRLHFKETLVDLVVPPLQVEKDGNCSEVEGGKSSKDAAKHSNAEADVSGKLSELKLSSGGVNAGSGGFTRAGEGSEGRQGARDGRVLVERDGKFDLVSLNEAESQGLLPPLASNYNVSSNPPGPRVGSSPFQAGADHLRAPRPPAQPRTRPNSATHSQRGRQKNSVRRRVQSATGTIFHATCTLSPQQKELLQKIQQRKEKLAREAEEKKREEDEQKRQDNDLAFKAWLSKKREQFQQEKRIQRAQEMERINSKKDLSDPDESFRLWVLKKVEQQQKERQMVELKRLEEDSRFLLRSREECERAFKVWLRRKRVEKRLEQQAAQERSRLLFLEERRARRVRDLLCTANETKPFRFTEQLAHPF